MKEIYIAPNAEIIIFTAKEKLTTNSESPIPYLDDARVGPPTGGSQWIEDV